MELTFIGGVIIGLGVLLSVASHKLLVQAVIFFASFSGTAIVNFGNYGMAPDVLLVALLLAGSVLSGRVMLPARVSHDHLLIGCLVLGFAAIAALSFMVNGAVHGMLPIQLTQTAYLMFGIGITLTLSVEFSNLERLEAGLVALRTSAVFISLWGLFQAACYYTGVEYPAFLFNNSTSHFADMYDQRAAEGVVRMASVATEPSFMALSLMIFGAFGSTVLALDRSRRTIGWVVPVGLTLATVALSTASTGYFGLVVLGFLLMRRRPLFSLGIIAGIGIVGGIWLMAVPSASDALYNMTLGKIAEGSYVERSTTFGPALELFMRQPWFGFGWGADYSYSLITQLMANVGIIGSAAFLAAMAATLIALRSARNNHVGIMAVYAEAIENALIVYLATSVVTGFKYVVADFWCLWALAIGMQSCLASLREDIPAPERITGSWQPSLIHHSR